MSKVSVLTKEAAPGTTQDDARSDARLRALLASTTDAILTVEPNGAIESVNAAAERLFAHPARDLIGHEFAALLGAPHHDEYADVVSAYAAGEQVEILGLAREAFGRRGDGSSFPLEITLTEMPVAEGRLLLATARDISERKRAERQLRHLADHDPLTGLLNRRSFEAALAKHIDYAERYGGAGSVLVLDMDNFKYVNDTLGHRCGDELINGVASLLRNRLRNTDVIARMGGDEFAILLPATDGEQAHTVARELRALVAEHSFVLERQPIRVTLSIGVAPLAGQGLTGPELLANADVAMYAAKEQGRDRIVPFTDEGQADLASRQALSERIRKATEEGLFVLVCQPIRDLAKGEITQHELLLRMRGEDGSLEPPGNFLGTAERFGLIQGIDRWVAQQAVRLLASHSSEGRDLVLEVNLSALTMNDAEFATMVSRELVSTGADPAKLVFEVTETAAVNDLNQARRFAESLTRIGCRFALDDFGAGFASFYYLKHLPISYLKIDGEFVKELTRSPADQLLVKALVQVSQGLGIKTIAEFVGDDETENMLREFGVDYAQGYHVGKPRPVAELRAA